jgi:hypothetical protein
MQQSGALVSGKILQDSHGDQEGDTSGLSDPPTDLDEPDSGINTQMSSMALRTPTKARNTKSKNKREQSSSDEDFESSYTPRPKRVKPLNNLTPFERVPLEVFCLLFAGVVD